MRVAGDLCSHAADPFNAACWRCRRGVLARSPVARSGDAAAAAGPRREVSRAKVAGGLGEQWRVRSCRARVAPGLLLRHPGGLRRDLEHPGCR